MKSDVVMESQVRTSSVSAYLPALLRQLGVALAGLALLVPGLVVLAALAAHDRIRYGHTARVEQLLGKLATSRIDGLLVVLLLPAAAAMVLVGPIERARYGQLSSAGKWLSVAALLCAGAAAPFVLGDYGTFQIAQALVFSAIVLGLNILTGYSGQISLGHGAFVLVGAYVTALLLAGRFPGLPSNIPVFAAVAAGAIASGGLGVLIGIPCLRLTGPYLALVTMALAVSAPMVLQSHYLSAYTGGASGVVLSRPEAPALFLGHLSDDQWQYFLTVVPSVLMIIAARNLLKGRTGRALRAVRDSEVGAQMAGIGLARYKLLAFGLSALYAGAGGGLLMFILGFISPDSFVLLDSINFLTAVVVGGIGSVFGSILGGVFLAFQADMNGFLAKLVTRGEDLRWAVYGAVVIGVMLYSPTGLAGKLYKKNT